MTQLWYYFAGFKKNCYEYLIVGRYPNIVRTRLFRVFTQRVAVISCGRFGIKCLSRFYFSEIQNVFVSRNLKIGPIVYSETLVRIYHDSLRNNQEVCSYHLFRAASLKSSTQTSYFVIPVMNV